MSSQPQPAAVQRLLLLSIRAFTFGFMVPGKTTEAFLAAACLVFFFFFFGISFNLLGEVESGPYFPFLLSHWVRSKGWGGMGQKRNTETSAVGFQNAFSLSFHLEQV